MIRLAVLTDAHYACGRDFLHTRKSSQSAEKLRVIFRQLPDIDALINLGDLVNATGNSKEDARNIRDIQALLGSLGAPCFAVIGNHDCEAAKKSAFLEKNYYDFSLGGVRFFALDANYISTGESYDDAPWDWKDAFIPHNQLDWLERELSRTEGPAVILCHQNLDDRPGDPHVIGNAAQVRAVLEASGKVRAVLQGHCHHGCFNEINGIPYYTFRALCEGNGMPYALVEIDGGRVCVRERDARQMIRVAGVVNDSIVDGPGMRLTVFTQGCPHGCPGCHNPQTHDFAGGTEMELEEIISRVRDNVLLSGVTLSGGEPFCQAAACAELARRCHALGLTVWTYTGYTTEQLLDGLDGRADWCELMSETDVLVDGPFILAQKSLDCRWRGSKNQRLIDARASLQAGRAVEWQG